MSAYPPTIEAQRQILTNMKNELQHGGFQSEMNAEALEAQEPGDGVDEKGVSLRLKHEQQIRAFRGSAKNAYAGARRLDEKLARLPKPKEDKTKKK